MSDKDLLIELVADELRKLVPHGVKSHRVVLLPHLREVVGIDAPTMRLTGNMMVQRLKQTILDIDEPQEFDGHTYEPAVVRRCLLLLLEFEGTGLGVEERRSRVIALLGMYVGLQTWRKLDHFERSFLRILAEQLVNLPDYQESTGA